MPTIPKHSTLVDLSVSEFATVGALFDIALLNDCSITDDLIPGNSWLKPGTEYKSESVRLPIVPVSFVETKVPVHVNLVDFCQQNKGHVAALFELSILNGISITEELTPGGLLKVIPGQVDVAAVILPAPVKAPDEVVLKKHQTLADWTTQYFGGISSLFTMAEINGISVTDEPDPGSILKRAIADETVVKFYADNGYDVSSSKKAAQVKPGGIGYMQIGNDFIVS